jgi:hypothetical protein
MKVEIKDERLIQKTGGIICGMSGSPIIQNNKLVRSINKCASIRSTGWLCSIWGYNDKRNDEMILFNYNFS